MKIDIRDYVVERTTADKLQDLLNDLAQVFDEIMPTYTGGRDWVVVASRPMPSDSSARDSGFGNVGRRPNPVVRVL